MTESIDRISISTSASADVFADHADLVVNVRGSTFFSGNAALEKAREVKQLVVDLTGRGIAAGAITLLGVSTETSSGALTKSSTAVYRIGVRVTQLDDLADVIGLIAAQKNTVLESTTWGYPDLAPTHDALLVRCLERARAKAQLIAQTLGVQVGGVHSVRDHVYDGETPQPRQPRMMADSMQRSRAMTGEDLGLDISHRKSVSVSVELEYRIAG